MTIIKAKLLCIFLALSYISGLNLAYAQTTEPTLKEQIPKDIIKQKARFITFTSENDIYGDGSDENYTNGARLTWFDYGTPPPWLAHTLDRYVPTFKINETTSTYYTIGQNLYTPEDITARTPNPQDRPYAAFLYASTGLTSLTDNHIDDIEATIGIIGPWAFGEQVQEAVHDSFNMTDPSGWDHQLENELGLILSWQRRWPAAYSTDIAGFTVSTTPHTGVTLGNVYTYGSGGFTFQLTPTKYKWQSPPPRVRPAIPGSGFFAVPDNHFAWSLFAGTEGRVMGRNIFLDGNTFEDSPSVDKRYFVADANAGISITYGNTQLSYTLNWRSREFRGQDDASVFGAISLGLRF